MVENISELQKGFFSQIKEVKVGHMSDDQQGTGCTVLLVGDPDGAVCGVDVRGGGPGTRETDLLSPTKTIQRIHALVFSGGSAYGLSAADGVMQFLEERGIGVDVGVGVVPIVPAAILFDLAIGNPNVRPDKRMGYLAAQRAEQEREWCDGNVGAGTGATVGKLAFFDKNISPMKGGLGSSVLRRGELYVGALAVVNAVGNVIDPDSGVIIAGAQVSNGAFVDLERYLVNRGEMNLPVRGNTTLGAIVTNASLSKTEATRLASLTQNAFVRTIRPVHTSFDGDTVFALSVGDVLVDVDMLGVLSIHAMQEAVLNAVRHAQTAHGVRGLGSPRAL